MTIKNLAIILILYSFRGYDLGAQGVKQFRPDYASLQYAGSTGWLGLATGYDLFKQRLRIGVQYGFVPKIKGGDLHILSSSLFYRPLKVRLTNTLSINPIDFGVKVSYQFGEDYYVSLPSKYPKNYYWWSSALRTHLATESSVTLKLHKNNIFKSASGYVEFNSNDLYLISYALNMKSLKLTDVVKAGIGVRLQF